MNKKGGETNAYLIGTLVSLVCHLTLFAITILILENSASTMNKAPDVFTVTLEGGEVLGGTTQVPKEGAKIKKPPLGLDADREKPEEKKSPGTDKETKTEPSKTEPPKEEVKEKALTQPAVVDDPEKLLKERKAAKEKKQQEVKKQEEEKKKLDEDAKKKSAEDQKKKNETEKKQRDDRLKNIANRFRTNYEGESASAGGEGFGAARVGGKGMGGGTLASIEKIAYANQLQEHVKSEWHWLAGSDRLRALVRVRLMPDGHINDVRIEQSSGNSNFDDSVVRAVRKSDPCPPPPTNLYADFEDVRFWFDSHEQ